MVPPYCLAEKQQNTQSKRSVTLPNNMWKTADNIQKHRIQVKNTDMVWSRAESELELQ